MTIIAKRLAFVSFYLFVGAYLLGLTASLSYQSWYEQPLYAALVLGYGVCLPALGVYFAGIGVLKKYLNHLSIVVGFFPILLIGSLLGWWRALLTLIALKFINDAVVLSISPNSVYILTLFILIAAFSYFQAKNFKVFERLFYPFIGGCILAIIAKYLMYTFTDLINFGSFIYFQLIYLPKFLYHLYQTPHQESDLIDQIGQ